MARTAPAPNIPPIPGMCPSVAVMGGGAGGGGGSGDGAGDGDGNGGAGGNGNGDGASGDGRNGGQGCGDPVCPATGRVFVDVYDFGFPGPFPLKLERSYNSRASHVAFDLGFGWNHSFGVRIIEKRSTYLVWDERCKPLNFDAPAEGEAVQNAQGLQLRRAAGALTLKRLDGSVLSFVSMGDGEHRLSAIKDRHGNTIQVLRGDRGELTGLIDSAGRRYRIQCDARGSIAKVSVATNAQLTEWLQLVQFEYDAEGRLVRAQDPGGFVWAYHYEGNLLTQHETPTGLSYFYRYDGLTKDARCIESWGAYPPGVEDPALKQPLPTIDGKPVPGIHYVALNYLPFRVTEVHDGCGLQRFFSDDEGRVIKQVDAASGVTTRTFDPDTSQLTSEVDALGKCRTVDRQDGVSTGVRYADGLGRHRVWLSALEEVETDDATGGVVQRSYDPHGNLKVIHHADGSTEASTWDDRGLLRTHADRQGRVTTYTHDAQGNNISTVLPDGSVEERAYDYLGRCISLEDGAGRRSYYRWDARNEIVEKTHADGTRTTVTWDANRRPTQITEGSQTTRFRYGGMGWLASKVEPDGATYQFRYDLQGRLVEATNPAGRKHTIEYDAAGRAVAQTTYEGERILKRFDAVGRAKAFTTADGKYNFEYDELGRLLKIDAPKGSSLEMKPGPFGFLKLKSGSVAVERDYDPDGNVTRERQGDHTSKIEWSGGAVARIKGDVGPEVHFEYGRTGRPSRIASDTTCVDLEAADGDDLVDLLGSSLVVRRTYGPNGFLSRQLWAKLDPSLPREEQARPGSASVILSREYEFDDNWLLRRTRDEAGRVEDVELDLAGRLLAINEYSPKGHVKRSESPRDAAGNVRMPHTRYDARGRPIEVAGEKLEYDARGRLIRRVTDEGAWTYEWSAFSELVSVRSPRRHVKLQYDGMRRRVGKRVYEQNRLVEHRSYVWSGDTLLREIDELRGTTRTYLKPDQSWLPVGFVDEGPEGRRVAFFVHDTSGAVDAVVDETGKMLFRGRRTPFGVEPQEGSDPSIRERLVNQHWDEDVGFVYNRYRWFDPRTGVFLSPDPLLLEGSDDLREYSSNSFSYADPRGLSNNVHTGQFNRAQPPPYGHPNRPPAPQSTSDLTTRYLSAPGHWATNGGNTAANPPGFAVANGRFRTDSSSFSDGSPEAAAIRNTVDAAGNRYGCHSCGASSPGTSNGHWIPDHQPPASQVRAADRAGAPVGQVRLYPHCQNCSDTQRDRLRDQGNRSRRTQTSEDARVRNAQQVSAAQSDARRRPARPDSSRNRIPQPRVRD